MSERYVSGAVEGPIDEAVLRAIVTRRGGHVHRVQVQRGKPGLRRALPGYNAAAQREPWLVLVDLDRDYPCAAALVGSWLSRPSRFMRLRVAVRQVESWLLADRERFAKFFGVPPSRVPLHPDQLDDAKTELLNLAATSSKRSVRLDVAPRVGSGRRVGPAYTATLTEFVATKLAWRPEVAARSSPSLHRCLSRVDELLVMK